MQELTDVEARMLGKASNDDLMLVADRIMRVVSMDSPTPRLVGMIVEQCAWFARCAEDATHLTPHSIHGPVPTCTKHNAFAGYGIR
jgi:hypothetical protein